MRRRVALLLLVLPLLAAGCFGGGGGGGEGTLIFAVASEPVALDGALAPDIESRRVAAQIFEGLVGLRPGTTELEPRLAETWQADASGRRWTFELRGGVRFHDGTALDAAAVCANFERWHRFRGSFRDLRASYYWQRVFGGFAGQASLYQRCTASGPRTVVLELTRPSAAFLSALGLPAFAIASPAALRRYEADAGTIDPVAGFRPAGTFATEHPIGTGPFRLDSWIRGDRVVLARNEDYWGEKPELERLVFRVIPDGRARLAALERGEIHGYDFVEPQDVAAMERNPDLRLLERPAFNVGYLTINQARPPLDRPAVRQALAYGLDRQRLADSFTPHGSAVVAAEFVPPEVFGYAPDVAQYPYDPTRAKRLLRQAGLKLPVRIEFWYPTGVSRPYLLDPQREFGILAVGLERAGFKVVARSAPWDGGYLVRVDEGKAGHVNLVGWTGDIGDPDDFVGTFFQQPTRQFGFRDAELFALLDRAEREPDRGQRAQLYQEANRRIMARLPGVPLVHTRQLLALRASVGGYISSPVLVEPFSIVSLSE